MPGRKSRPAARPTGRTSSGPGALRIIAGVWRGRRVPILDRPGLRPTTDRVRETVFNWLQPILPGARCLDLFAGAGGLGFEAASRGAAGVVMIERDPGVARHLQVVADTLGAGNVRVVAGEALGWLDASHDAFDVVFVDPPFAGDLAAAALARLAEGGHLRPGARVYLETAAQRGLDPGPAWTALRDQTAGEARYRLLAPAAPP